MEDDEVAKANLSLLHFSFFLDNPIGGEEEQGSYFGNVSILKKLQRMKKMPFEFPEWLA